jgi:hypothetical protein
LSAWLGLLSLLNQRLSACAVVAAVARVSNQKQCVCVFQHHHCNHNYHKQRRRLVTHTRGGKPKRAVPAPLPVHAAAGVARRLPEEQRAGAGMAAVHARCIRLPQVLWHGAGCLCALLGGASLA